MGMVCTICGHPEREAIDHAIVSGLSIRGIACRWHVGRESVRRHALRHVSPALKAMQAASVRAKARTTLERMETQYELLEDVVKAAREDGRDAMIVNAAREMRQTAELLAKITHELDTRPVTNVINLQSSAEWIELRGIILAALTAYPDARTAVAGRLLELEAGPS